MAILNTIFKEIIGHICVYSVYLYCPYLGCLWFRQNAIGLYLSPQVFMTLERLFSYTCSRQPEHVVWQVELECTLIDGALLVILRNCSSHHTLFRGYRSLVLTAECVLAMSVLVSLRFEYLHPLYQHPPEGHRVMGLASRHTAMPWDAKAV